MALSLGVASPLKMQFVVPPHNNSLQADGPDGPSPELNRYASQSRAARMASEKLKIDIENAEMGNRALASVLLLYYHLLREGGITNDQTVYVNSEDFDPFKYVGAEVSIELSDIDQKLLQEGAVVLLLCDLNDLIGEYESDYLKQPHVKRILAALSDGCEAVVPEIIDIKKLVTSGESQLNYQDLSLCLKKVYERYVVGRFRSFLASEA